MGKYIIKNCFAYSVCGICISQEAECLCKDCTDCLLKRIVELCDEYKNNYCINNGVHLLIGEILNLLEIEVE